jgi:radical SAM protein with 4Fe4S-binding SPASM domain
LRLSYYYNQIKKDAQPWGMPYSISVEPTTHCNLHCLECPSGQNQFTRQTGNLDIPTYTKIMDELHSKLLYMILYFQGEPYLNKHFFDFVKIAKKHKIYTATSTNGHYLNEENARRTIEAGLDRLIISMDGLDQETYEKYRIGGNLKTVSEGIKTIVGMKNKMKSAKPYIILQFIVFGTNEHQISGMKQFARELGVDKLELKSAQIYDYQQGSPLIPKNEKYSRYRRLPDGTYEMKNKMLNKCWRMWSSCVLTWDAKVVPCCFDKDADFQMGTLSEDNFQHIWTNIPYQKFRQQVFTDRQAIDICRNCTEGTRARH